MDALRALVLPALGLCALGPVDAWQRRASLPLDLATRLACAFALALGWLEVGGVVLGFSHTLRLPFVITWIAIGVGAAFAVGRPRVPRVRVSPWLVIAAVAVCGYAAM